MEQVFTEAAKQLGQQGILGLLLFLSLLVNGWLARQLTATWKERLEESLRVIAASMRASEALASSIERMNAAQEARGRQTEETTNALKLLAKDLDAHHAWAQNALDELRRMTLGRGPGGV